MKLPRIREALITLILTFASPASGQEATIVQPFAGSAHVGEYAADFDQVTVMRGEGTEVTEVSVEGLVRTNIYRPPAEKSILEIRRSFEQALEAAGFNILYNGSVSQAPERKATLLRLRTINAPRRYTDVRGADIVGWETNHIYTYPQHYLSAVREQGGQRTVFAVTLTTGGDNIYLLEEATAGVQEEGTVTISEAGLSSDLEDAGKAILYGVQFDTGSAVIRPSSTSSLEVIANVLNSREGRFYVVGHTSDTGGFELNMQLSAERAQAIIDALGSQYGIDTTRLQAAGVGPVAPLASNDNEAGRQLNRRVELVDRLEN